MKFQDIPLEEILFFHAERMMKKAKDYTVATFKREDIDITKDQWVILKAIADQAGMTQSELSAKTYRDPASIKRSLDILMNKELIDKKVSPSDSKALCVFLSRKGANLVKKIIPHIQDIRARAFKGLSKNDIQTAQRVLIKMKDNLS